MNKNPYDAPNSELANHTDGNTGSNEHAEKLAKGISYLGLSFLLVVISNAIVLTLFKGTNLVYLVIPFNIGFIACIVWLTWLTYGVVMATLTAGSIFFPPFAILMFLLSCNKASKTLKSMGLKATTFGKLQNIK